MIHLSSVNGHTGFTIDTEGPVSIIVLGLGGVGGRIALRISEILRSIQKDASLLLVDRGTVEPKHLRYQVYTKDFEGRHKSSAVSSLCSSRDINSYAFIADIKDCSGIMDLIEFERYPLIINTIQSPDVTKSLAECISSISRGALIDISNHPKGGRINFSFIEESVLYPDTSISNLSKPSPEHEEDYDFSEKMLSDDLAALIAYNIADKILRNKPLCKCMFSYDMEPLKISCRYFDGAIGLVPDILASNSIVLSETDFTILVAGAGGIGSRVSYLLAQIAKESKKHIKILIFDKDTVEVKNLERQNFLREHVGQNKAEATVKGCKKRFEDTFCVPIFISSPDDILGNIEFGSFPLIVGASDSLALRLLLSNTLKMLKRGAYIDAGNSTETGQVIMTFREKGQNLTNDIFEEFPAAVEDALKAKLVTELSCSDIMPAAPQTMLANDFAAFLLAYCASRLICGKPIDRYIYLFNSDTITVSNKPIIKRRA